MNILIEIIVDLIIFTGRLTLTVVPVYYWWNYGLSDDLNLPSLNILDVISISLIIDLLFKGESFSDFMKKSRKNKSDH